MAIANRLSVSNLSQEDWNRVKEGIATQSVGRQAMSRSWDNNYPVWSAKSHGKFHIYVPEHRDDNGNMIVDRVNVHLVNDGSRFGTQIRCIQNINIPELGLNGICPLDECASRSTSWFFDILEERNIDPQADDQASKDVRSHLNKMKAVQESSTRYVFPVVYLEAKQGGGTEPHPYWMDMSEKQWAKINGALDALGLDSVDPAGRLFTFNYGNDENASVMDSARDLTITLMHKQLSDDVAVQLNEMTAEWDVRKSMETVKIASLYSVEDLTDMGNKALERMMASRTGLAAGSASTPSAQVASAGTPTAAQAGLNVGTQAQVVDATDADIIDAEVVPSAPHAPTSGATSGGDGMVIPGISLD